MTRSLSCALGLGFPLGLECSRLGRCAGLALVDLVQERVERPLHDRGGVAVWDLVGEQILELLQLVAAALAERDLKLPAAR